MRTLVKITKALADPGRLLALRHLADGECCVCHIVTRLGLAPSTVSKHLSILENAGLVQVRRLGRWAHYSLARGPKGSLLEQVWTWLLPALAAVEPASESVSRRPHAR